MQVHHIGYRIRGFYRVAKIGHCWDMNTHAQKRTDILRFWQTHGSAATCDAFKVSRRTLYRWQQNTHPSRRRPGSPDAALAGTQTPPPAIFRREVVDEIRRLRKVHPNLGKLPLSVFIKTWCQTHKYPIPSVSTIGRIIDREPDKMRHAPLRLDRRGRHKPLRQTRKTRRPKGISTRPALPHRPYPDADPLCADRQRLGVYEKLRKRTRTPSHHSLVDLSEVAENERPL